MPFPGQWTQQPESISTNGYRAVETRETQTGTCFMSQSINCAHKHTRSEKLCQGPVNVGMKIGYTQGPCKRKVHC